MKRYGQYFTAMVEEEDGDYYKVSEVDERLAEIREIVMKGLEDIRKMILTTVELEVKMSKYERALQWIAENPFSHYTDIRAVVEEALK